MKNTLPNNIDADTILHEARFFFGWHKRTATISRIESLPKGIFDRFVNYLINATAWRIKRDER